MAYPGVVEDADFPKKGYAMKEGTVVGLRQPGSFSDDPLTDILRSGARQLLAQAIEAEVGAHIAAHACLSDGRGRRRVESTIGIVRRTIRRMSLKPLGGNYEY